MYSFMCQTIPNIFSIFLIYILFTKMTETFGSRDVTDIWGLAYFELKILKDC